jgi:hypothetical protein
MSDFNPPRHARIVADVSRQTHAKLAPKLGLNWGAYVDVISQPTPDAFRVETRHRRIFTVPVAIVEFLVDGETPPARPMPRRATNSAANRPTGRFDDGSLDARPKRRIGGDNRPPIMRVAARRTKARQQRYNADILNEE